VNEQKIQSRTSKKRCIVFAAFLLLFAPIYLPAYADESDNAEKDWQELEVTASAYTIAEDETKRGHRGLAAWGDRIKPGMRVIAVSRDLIKRNLGHGARVKIEGLPGIYHVRDKMHRRWRNKIDILVPTKKQAFRWGKRTVRIKWLADGE